MESINRGQLFALADPFIHDALTERLERPATQGILVFENLQMDSSAFGARTFIAYGPGYTYANPEAAAKRWLNDLPSQRQYPTKFYVKEEV